MMGSARSLQCTLTTPEERVFEGAVHSVVVPAPDGELGILPRHAPLVGSLGFGELRLEVEGEGTVPYFVNGGFLQVLDDHVSILAAEALPARNLDEAAEEARLREIEGRPPGRAVPADEREEYSRSLAVSRARLRLARKT